MNGIDISQHNGFIDFSKLKEQGIEFVIIRIGWIGNKENHTKDLYFEDYYKRAKENNLKIGFYVYNYCKSEQAVKSGTEWTYKQLQNKSFELPVFIDQEEESIRICGKQNLTRQTIIFCEYFKSKGIKTGIYANKNWFTNYLDINKLLDYKIWLAEWNSKITFKYKVDLWQYTANGQLKGITSKYVDMNKCMCNCNENNQPDVDNPAEKNEDFEMIKKYENGSTIEIVYSDSNCTNKIGSLNRFEKCDCLGIYKNKAIVRYKIDNQDNYKIRIC